MPGRTLPTSGGYRYGFNGKEEDDELKGNGNQQDYGMRIYDPRVGRFLSIDPLIHLYVWYTPYQFAGNKPIWAIDIDGAEEWMKTQHSLLQQKVLLKQQTAWQNLATIKPSDGQPNFWGKLRNEIATQQLYNPGNVGPTIIYGIIDDAHITFTSWKYGKSRATHLDNGIVDSYKERIGAGLNTFTLLLGGIEMAAEKAFLSSTSILKSSYNYGEARVFTQVGKNSVEIGSGGIGTGGYLEIEINVKVGENGARVANGETVFNELFKTISEKANVNINGIRGRWYYGSNLKEFNRLITEKVSKGFMTEEEAALQTFTGRMASKRGFNKVESIAGKKNADGTYKYVNSIIFAK